MGFRSLYTRRLQGLQIYFIDVPDRAHFLSSFSFIEFQTVEFEYVSISNFARVFWVLARVISVFWVFSTSSLAEFELNMRVKNRRRFEFEVASSGTTFYGKMGLNKKLCISGLMLVKPKCVWQLRKLYELL